MTSSPSAPPSGKKAALSSVNKAIKSQEEIAASLTEQGLGFLGEGAPQTFEEASEELKYVTGKDPAQWISSVEGRFYPAMEAMTESARKDLRKFDPGLIGSKSTRKVTDYINAATDRFQQGIEDQSLRGRERLLSLPQMAIDYASQSYKNPAFNMMLDEQAMNMAENPKTVRQDDNYVSDARRWMTYNV